MNKEIEEVCKKHGFDFQIIENGMLITKPKDIWEGVEFAKVGKIRKIKSIDANRVYFDNDSWAYKENCDPSNEQSYIEQLKKEAFDRFGEIKEGDRFDRTPISEKWGSDTVMEKSAFGNFHWKYDKSNDTLFIGNYGIYKSGKWATRVNERVKVVSFSNMGDIKDNSMRFIFDISGKKIEQFHLYSVSEFLASKLEAYLNGETE